MAVIKFILTPWALLFVPAYLVFYYIVPYFTTYAHLQDIKGPLSAKFSNTWLAFAARRGQKFAAVDWAHRNYGNIVRLAFNHVPIADERALQVVYGHGNGFLKEYTIPRPIPDSDI
jgi:benzoate 4-monooxygenase